MIQKAPETMTARERVQATFRHEKTDRVTIGYQANPAVHQRVAAALGIPSGDWEAVRQALGVDYRSLHAPYIGPNLFPERPGRQIDQIDGFVTRWVANQSGGYWDFCDFPLKGADDETIANYPVPNPDDFDYEALAAPIAAAGDLALYIGGAGIPDLINSTGRLMGMEDTLVNLMQEDEATLIQLNRRMDMRLKVLERTLERWGKHVDFMWLGEDLGTQHTPMISLKMFRQVLRPVHQRFVDLAKSYDVPVLVHTCGSSSWAYEDFIEMGISGVDTLQPEATNMSPEYLKEHFGGRLCFRGCISTAGPLAYGTAEEVTEVVRHTLSVMMPGGGYHFAPTHEIQDNTPAENVLAMYQAAHDYGRYE